MGPAEITCPPWHVISVDGGLEAGSGSSEISAGPIAPYFIPFAHTPLRTCPPAQLVPREAGATGPPSYEAIFTESSMCPVSDMKLPT
jgi:hypothetical protein